MKLEIKNLHASIGEKEILKGVNLSISTGEMHVLMGPNGSGKTVLTKAVLGHPGVKITEGDILADGKSILGMTTDERARLGIFLQFQEPVEIEGVGFINFLRSAKAAYENLPINVSKLVSEVNDAAAKLHIEKGMIGRSLNFGMSGGEKKKAEILQMAILKPKIAILDEPDSGLDVDAVKIVASNITSIFEGGKVGMLLITHYSRILEYMKPQFVHVMLNGRIIANGGLEIVSDIEKNGYDIFNRV
ncbi:MAG: Fe-S cluster assembly ATPase SufC [Candidatus Micrarchaeia archaeon]